MKRRDFLITALLAPAAGYGVLAKADETFVVARPVQLPLAEAVAEMVQAAGNLLAALSPEQVAQATFEFENAERVNWHFIPRVRKGLPLRDMTSAQKALANAMLASGLSGRGYVSAVTIMSLDQILADMEQGKGPKRDPEGYFFSIFGKPADGGTWGWRVEGHHLSVNFTIVKGAFVAAAPTFMGDNPAQVREGPRQGLRTLAQEEDIGRRLVKSLSPEQLRKATIPGEVPREIVTGNSRKAMLADLRGILFGELDGDQKEVLGSLIRLYAGRLRREVAECDLKRIDAAGVAKIRFAWAGETDLGKPHYYRIQGPTFLVEYDNTQNNANHIHTVWRDLENDFGDDILKEHYDTAPAGHGH
ncbi:MAG: DUF3500 domain-containing protein [Tepidisphaeraceae bacterium]|jgi:hypothetical protein